jgi:tetratricopeptide (TPR) repeat protein
MKSLALLLFLAATLAAFPASAPSFDQLAAQATAAREGNDVAQAIQLYRQALEANPSWSEGWWFLGTLFYDSDQYSSGQEAFAHFVKLDQSAAPGWSFLGLCEFETGNYSDALDHIRRGLESPTALPQETQAVLRFHEALLLTRLGQFDAALPVYLPIVRSGVENPVLIAGMGLTALGRPLLPKEIPADQRDLVMAAGKTAWLWTKGNTSEAEQAFRDLLAAFPTAPGVHHFYGTWLIAGHPDKAVAEFQRELQIDPHNARARAMIALMMMRAGQEKDALPLARQAAEDGPSVAMARYVYGVLLVHAGNADGVANLEAAEKMDPNNFEFRMALAGAYSKFGRYDDARRERQASIAMAKQGDPDAKQ